MRSGAARSAASTRAMKRPGSRQKLDQPTLDMEAESMVLQIIAHGGATSLPSERDGPEQAVHLGYVAMKDGAKALDAACKAVALLEDDPRFNAGTGSNLRFDGKTIEMDASCMDGDSHFGAVACLRNVRNPIRVAQRVLDSPHAVLAGEGANRFARALGFEPYDPWTERAQARHDLLMKALQAAPGGTEDMPWNIDVLRTLWNFEVAFREVVRCDTVGAVAYDGHRFAAALSTGGIGGSLMGRVGDVPLPGCGLFAGPAGAICCTGDGDRLARRVLASQIYGWLESGMTAVRAYDRAMETVPRSIDLGLLILSRDGYAAGSNREMAWAMAGDDL